MAGGLRRGDVHLCQFAAPDKKRPVVLLTRASILGHLGTVTVAPITSTIRGVVSEVPLGLEDGMKGPCAINLHNIATLPLDRIGKRVCSLREPKIRQLCASMKYALGCD
jgi:mRNA interferase MazF